MTVANIHPNCDFFVLVGHTHVTATSTVYMTPVTAWSTVLNYWLAIPCSS